MPTRADNIWDGLDHESVASKVMRDEASTGIARSRAEEAKTANDVESLYRQQMRKEGDR